MPSSARQARWRRAMRQPAVFFSAAVLVRLTFFVAFLHSVPIQKVWKTGLEASYIAASVVSGHGFASPFGIPTGPSAWIPPGYVCILVVLFKLVGTYSAAAAWSALILNALFAGGTTLAMGVAGETVLGHDIGVVSAWVWVFSPYAAIMSLKVGDSSFSALLIMAGSLLYWRLRESESLRDWGFWGLFWGCTMLVNPVAAISFPVLSMGALWRKRKPMLPRFALAAAISCAVVAPWVARNYVRFHTIFPIRSNFAEELWLGNHQGLVGLVDETRHPLGDPSELASYRDLGERDYLTEKQREAVSFIRSHPAKFVRVTLSRIAFFWSAPPRSLWFLISILSFLGLVLAMNKNFLQTLPFAAAMLLYPGVYYVTHADNWYRYPIEPVMLLLAVYAVASVAASWRRRRSIERAAS